MKCNCGYSIGHPLVNKCTCKQWVGLTDEEMQKVCVSVWKFDQYAIARAIEAKLKEKNT